MGFRSWLSSRLRRSFISGGVLLSLLFMQFAALAYGCPQLVPTEQSSSAMPDCHLSKDMAKAASQHDGHSALCKAHCGKDGQSTASSAIPDLQPNPAALTLLFSVVEPTACHAPVAGQLPWHGEQGGAPPIYLSLVVLRN